MVDPIFRLSASQFFLNEILGLRTLLRCFQLILQSGGPKKYRRICLAFGTYYVKQRLSLRGTEVPIIYLFEQIHFFPLISEQRTNPLIQVKIRDSRESAQDKYSPLLPS